MYVPETDVTQHFVDQLTGVVDGTPVLVYYIKERSTTKPQQLDSDTTVITETVVLELVSAAVLAGEPILCTNWNKRVHEGVEVVGPLPVYVAHCSKKIPQFRFN